MDGLLPWYCYNDVGAYRAVAPWYEGMVWWHAVGESRSGKGIRPESFFVSLALFLLFTVRCDCRGVTMRFLVISIGCLTLCSTIWRVLVVVAE